MQASAGLSKVEGLIMPVSAAVTFFGDDIKLVAAGDWNGVIAQEAGYLRAWHPPTVLGLTNALSGPLGQGAFTAVVGWAIGEAGKIMGSGMVGRIGGDFEKAGHGVMIGGLADMLVRPTKYNPGAGGAPGLGMGDHVMQNPLYYERTGKAASSEPLLPR